MIRLPLLLAIGPVLAGAVLVAVFVVAVSARPLARSEPAAVADAVRRSLELEGEAVDEMSREALRSSLLGAKTAEAGAVSRAWRPWHSPEAADRAWHESARAAWHHARTTQRRRTELAAAWRSALERAEGCLAEVRGRAGRLGNKAGVAALRAAESSLALAHRWAQQGRFEPAVAAAQESVVHLESFDAVWDSAHSRFDEAGNRRRWAQWVAATLEVSRKERGVVLLVDKLRRRVEVYDRGARVAVFDAELGSGGLQAKLRAGDRATPEGRYKVTEKRNRGATRYYKALMLDYPNGDDRERFRSARRRGEIPGDARIGGLIEIHGRGGQGLDWTDGCVALSDADMDRLFTRVRVGTPVTIVGTVP